MRFGVCTAISNASMLKAAGWDFVEESVQRFLQPEVAESEWQGENLAREAGLPVEAANVLMPGGLKITGPAVDFAALRKHIGTVMMRAGRVGIKTVVFGSGGARNVPEGFDRERARGQILDFVRMAAEAAGANGVVVVVEPLRRGECNILNSVAEAMGYVREVSHPALECLVDSYHFWEENEPLESLKEAMPRIRHVHVADRGTRLAPGQTAAAAGQGDEGMAEYLGFFRVLKAGGYDGRISVEGTWKPELAADAGPVLGRLKEIWAKA